MRTKRGVTRAKDVWSLPGGEKIVVSCNKFGQPVKKSGGILGGWLGTVARKANLCPIHYPTWKKMPNSFKINIINLTRVSNHSLFRIAMCLCHTMIISLYKFIRIGIHIGCVVKVYIDELLC